MPWLSLGAFDDVLQDRKGFRKEQAGLREGMKGKKESRV